MASQKEELMVGKWVYLLVHEKGESSVHLKGNMKVVMLVDQMESQSAGM